MPQTLYVIDGYAQIFRAFYAIRGGMRSPVTGEPTHAVFGFTGMLLKLFGTFKPDYALVAIDMPGKTFRDEIYTEYKATRNETPDELIQQIPRVLELSQHFGLPVVGHPGLEADDVIATITHRILNDPQYDDVHIRIVSKDKDLEQLLGPRVCMFDIHTDTLIDEAALLANKGITPQQVIDLLALTGDTVDNVPGVNGIGPKTAAQLIQEFGSIDGIFANIEQIKGKRRENLEAARGHLPLSRTLVTLKCDGEFEFALTDARCASPDCDKLVPFFQQLGFNRYQDEVRKLAGFEPAPEEGLFAAEPQAPPADLPRNTGEYTAVTTRAQLDELVAALKSQSMIAFDTETTGLEKNSKLCGLSFAWKPGHGVYVPTLSPEPEAHLDTQTVLDALKPVLEDASIKKCGHNVKFDAAVLLCNGVRVRGVAFDSLLASALVDPKLPGHKLDFLAENLLGVRLIPITDLIGSGPEQKSMDQVPLTQIVPYAAEDADIALRLYEYLNAKIGEMGMERLLAEVEAPLALVIAHMESHGVRCNPDELVRQGEALASRVDDLRRQIMEIAGCEFDLNSPKQLGDVLFDRLGLTPGKKTKTGRSTDIEVLEKLSEEEDADTPASSVPRLVLEYRQCAKLISTYLGNLRTSINGETGRIHQSRKESEA